MSSMTYIHRIAGTLALLLAMAAAAGQGVPRDEYPLPPAAPIGLQEAAAPAAQAVPGGDAADAAGVGGLGDMHEARAALDELLRAYEAGNVAQFRQGLDPSMVGYQVFLEGVRRDVAAYRNLRINLVDTQVTAGPDLAVIQTAWEKRFLSAADFSPGIYTGRSTLLLHREGRGWRLSAVAQDNPFSSASGVLARFTLLPAVLGMNSLNGNVPLRIEVVDPDMAGAPGVNIAVSTSNGDRETLQLPAVAPGVFRITTAPIVLSVAPVPGNQVVETSWPSTISFRYLDANPGDNRPASTLTRSLRVQ
ncbi:MAG: nuclear transport factor 2 family protein [Gammaproteobacteria bacterium]|nr:nuclear transport factor 2 family protein [Gammaproteobacteria bacterium]